MSRVDQSEKTTCKGTRSASQKVPLKRRPRTGGNAREPDMTVVLAELTESFLGGNGVDTPLALRDGGGVILAAPGYRRKANPVPGPVTSCKHLRCLTQR